MRRRKILYFLFLLVMALSSSTTFLSYKLARQVAFSQFQDTKALVTKEKILTISFPDSSVISWERKDKEFSFNGKLYDVVSIKKEGPTMIVRCIADVHEDKIILTYVNSFDHSKQNANDKVTIPLIKDKLCITNHIFINSPEILYTNIEIILNQPTFLSPSFEIFSPPPEHSSAHIVG